MERRHFLGMISASAITNLIGSSSASRCLAQVSDASSGLGGSEEIAPYFLDSGILTREEQKGMEELVAYQTRVMVGESAIRPRGRSSRAATYRLVRWEADIGGIPGSFRGPLSVRPLRRSDAFFGLNAQIIGFHLCSEDWPKSGGTGALTVEFRGGLMGEPLTWLYGRQFDIDEKGSTTLGMEFVAERDGAPQPVITDAQNVNLRIQLMHLGDKGGGFLKKVFKVASYITGISSPSPGSFAAKVIEAAPVVRVPAMLSEGVALSQTLVGGSSEQTPIWRSGFVSYALTDGGGRLALAPGIWVVLDETREEDLRRVQIAERRGQALLVRDGQILDVNHLVLDVNVFETGLPPWALAIAAGGARPEQDYSYPPQDSGFGRGIVPKQVPPQNNPPE